MVTCNGYRNPALLAKMASTVDVLSHGRLDFGIGAGWYEQEFRAYGYDFPDGPTRLKQLRDAVQIILKMWSDEQAEYEGQYLLGAWRHQPAQRRAEAAYSAADRRRRRKSHAQAGSAIRRCLQCRPPG